MKKLGALVFMCLLAALVVAADTTQLEQAAARLNDLFPPEQAKAFTETLPVDQEVKFVVYQPQTEKTHGVMVFISPSKKGAPNKDWLAVLEKNNLAWIGAEGFGNEISTARRMLAAIMGLTLIKNKGKLDKQHVYVAGVSGGGKVASGLISRFPQYFSGALFMVGVDPLPKPPNIDIENLREKRFVFLTGSKDFNRRPVRRVYRRYKKVGIDSAYLVDAPGFGHEYPNAALFEKALVFLLGEQSR